MGWTEKEGTAVVKVTPNHPIHTDAIKRAYDDLQSKFQDISAELYKQASAGQGAGAQAGPQPGPETQSRPGSQPQGEGARRDGDVVDAEFEVVDEDKKK